MASTRLPGKPLLKIGDKTVIERCVEQARKADFLPWVATDHWEIVDHIKGKCPVVYTEDCPSGTDRVAQAAEKIDPEGKHEFVINYQGDMPYLEPALLKYFVDVRDVCSADILTAYCDQDMVAMMMEERMDAGRRNMRLHIGLYGYKREALKRFAAMPQGESELREGLEQMRAPDQFSWAFVSFPSMPIEINTQADLDRARSCLM